MPQKKRKQTLKEDMESLQKLNKGSTAMADLLARATAELTSLEK